MIEYNPNPTPPPFWMSLMPLFVYSLIFAGIVVWLAPRKGLSPLWALIVLVPCIGPFFMIYLLALTDKKVLDEITELKNRIENK